jgi:hypothetical protein
MNYLDIAGFVQVEFHSQIAQGSTLIAQRIVLIRQVTRYRDDFRQMSFIIYVMARHSLQRKQKMRLATTKNKENYEIIWVDFTYLFDLAFNFLLLAAEDTVRIAPGLPTAWAALR